MFTSFRRQIPNAYVKSQCFRATPGALSRALADPQVFKPALDLQQPRFIAVQLDLRLHAASAVRVTSADGHTEERQPLRTTRPSPWHLTVDTADEPDHEGGDSALALSLILEPVRGEGRSLERVMHLS